MKSKLAWAAFLAALAVSVGLRLCVLSSAEQGWGLLTLALCAVLLAGSAVCFFAARTDHTMVRLPLTGTVLGVTFAAAGVLLAGVSVVYQAWNRTGRFAVPAGGCTLLAVWAGLLLCLQGCQFLVDGQNFFGSRPMLAQVPAIWCGAQLALQIYVDTETPLNLQNVLCTGALGLLLLTLFSLAQMSVQKRRVSRGRLFGFGFPTLLFTAASVAAGGQATGGVPGLAWLLAVMAAFVLVSLLTVRPMTKEELTGETATEEKPEVRPVIMSGSLTPQLPRRQRVARPVVASREDPRLLTPREMDDRLEHQLLRYLDESYEPKCFFYTNRRHT